MEKYEYIRQETAEKKAAHNTRLYTLVKKSDTVDTFLEEVRRQLDVYMRNHRVCRKYAQYEISGYDTFEILSWEDYAAVTLWHLLENEGTEFFDGNTKTRISSRPLELFWMALKKGEKISGDLFAEMHHLFTQFYGDNSRFHVTQTCLEQWMGRHPSGLDEDIVARREKNKKRIISYLAEEIEHGPATGRFSFPAGLSREEKISLVYRWWEVASFHLAFAVRNTERLFRFLGDSLDAPTARVMKQAEKRGIPIFVNPYYLSLLNAGEDQEQGDDAALRMYVFYDECLIGEFGRIQAWEKEDQVVIGEPNAAGWLLPSHNIHRRYPEVAILIPDTVGRACGGLCSSCQRMYGFQSGDFNFDLEKLAPRRSWKDKLECLLNYYENDSRLRDILITGGDALMSTNANLEYLFDRILAMIERKIENNTSRDRGYAEIQRIRLGTRLPVYLPQRIDAGLLTILTVFKKKAEALGVSQCVIQTHFESAMEVTPEVSRAVAGLRSTGWYITNQQVFTAAASLRGHTAKLRKILTGIGVFPYYTFSVKGFTENRANFATNARLVQEQQEEKIFGAVNDDVSYLRRTRDIPAAVRDYQQEHKTPFIALDRSVINLPGVGKSLTFRTVGFAPDGRRILCFDHDKNRTHSPLTEEMGRVIIVESKSVGEYLRQIEEMGEDPEEYEDIFGYRIAETERRTPFYEYPDYDYTLSAHITHFAWPDKNSGEID